MPLSTVVNSFSWSNCWNSVGCKQWVDDLKVIQISWWIWMRAFDTQTVIEIWNTLKECKLELSIRLKYWLFTLYIRYILLIPSPTKEDCARPKSQILTKFNPSINSGGGGSIVLKQKTCKSLFAKSILMCSNIFHQIWLIFLKSSPKRYI